MSFPPGYFNCHARGLHSVVVDRYGDGRPRVRMFVTDTEHTLWKNQAPGRWGPPMSLAIHAHRMDVTLVRCTGRPQQVAAYRVPDGPITLGSWHYRSAILTGTGGFTRVGSDTFVVEGPFTFDVLSMRAAEMHTVYVPRGERASWLVIEGVQTAEYDEVLYSDDALDLFDFVGMYVPMTDAQAAGVLGGVL